MEDITILIFLAADFLLILTAAVYGWKFFKKRNTLLGLECWIVAISATNLLFSALLFEVEALKNISLVLYNNALYLDAFSRAVGLPLIAVAGTMAVTHGYHPSKLVEFCLFVGGFAVAGVLMVVAPENRYLLGQFAQSELVLAIEVIKPWFYLIMWSFFSCFLVYFCWRLFQVKERLLGWSVIVVLVAGQTIATIYDFFHIPGDDEHHTIFYIAALSTWALMVVVLYYAYSALERSKYTNRHLSSVKNS